MRFLAVSLCLLSLQSCGDMSPDRRFGENIRESSDANALSVFGEGSESFVVAGSNVTAEVRADSSSSKTETVKFGEDGLSVGLPSSAFGTKYLFGGVITKAAHKTDRSIGSMKLADFEPIHVMPILSPKKDSVSFYGCSKQCESDVYSDVVFTTGVVGKKEIDGTTYYVLNMDDLVKNMRIVEQVSSAFSRGFRRVNDSKIVRTDYSDNTFVFDVKTGMSSFPLFSFIDKRKPTSVESRWFLKPSKSVIAQGFAKRDPRAATGFFLTKRFKKQQVTRFAKPSENGSRKIKYYIKGAPKMAHKGMSLAFEDWNEAFVGMTGEEILEWEFISKEDERFDKILTGDIRYNVIEWDTANKASYGGLGPSIAFQATGQILSGNVLIQGPQIVKRHRQWFGLEKATKEQKSPEKPAAFTLEFNENFKMRVPALMPEYADPIMAESDLANPTPKGVSYDEYMTGYFRELTAHELGHNLGLRHNFKGNLGASDDPEFEGTSSRSVMDYLGRAHRHKSTVSSYDRMAIGYAYAGVEPKRTNWFCTDQDVINVGDQDKSPECQRYDLTNDPYAYWRDELKRSLENYVKFSQALEEAVRAPEDKKDKALIAHVSKQKEASINMFDSALNGMYAFASTAEKTSDKWQSWQRSEDRPDSPEEIRAYIGKQATDIICPESATRQLQDMRTSLLNKAKGWKLPVEQFACKPNVKVMISL